MSSLSSEAMNDDDYDDIIEEDSDPVVSEMPVYLTHALTSQLYVIQSPLRPADRPYEADFGPVHSLKVKPNQKRVEFEYRIREDDDDEDEDMLLTSTNKPAMSRAHYDENTQQKIKTFKLNGRPVASKTNYVIGAIRDGALHLTPLSTVVRLKPDISYLDARAAEEAAILENARLENERERQRLMGEEDEEADNASADESGEQNGVKNEMKAVAIKFKKKESERTTQYREKSYAFIKQLEDSEPWIKASKANPEDEDSLIIREQLYFDPESESNKSIQYLSPSAYLQYINPAANESLNHSLPERVLRFLRSAHLAPFYVICDKLAPAGGADSRFKTDCMAACDQFAFYIQGAFAIKSVLLFDRTTTAKSMSDVKIEGAASAPHSRRVLTRNEMARDYLMTQYYHHRILDRAKLHQVMRLPPDQSDERMNEFGTKLPDRRGWEWRWPVSDTEEALCNSVESFQTILQTQHQQIKEMETRAKWALETEQPKPNSRLPATNSIAPKSAPKPSSASGSAHGQAIQLLESEFRSHGVCSKPYLLNVFHKSQNASPALAAMTDELFQALVHSHALCISGDLYIRKSLNNVDVDPSRAVIASLFAQRSSVKKADVEIAIESALKQSIPDTVYRSVMKELAHFAKGTWFLKKGDPTVKQEPGQ